MNDKGRLCRGIKRKYPSEIVDWLKKICAFYISVTWDKGYYEWHKSWASKMAYILHVHNTLIMSHDILPRVMRKSSKKIKDSLLCLEAYVQGKCNVSPTQHMKFLEREINFIIEFRNNGMYDNHAYPSDTSNNTSSSSDSE